MLSRKAKHLAYVTEILRSAQNDIHHLVCDRALDFRLCDARIAETAHRI